ncbi:MAG: DUF3488 domain-containing protein, partial [Oligoflexales bacterium]|nr:DUF3488 domain-containing protein [Oligoflexales bacterium]
VRFEKPPDIEQPLYFRIAVMEESRGMIWLKGSEAPWEKVSQKEPKGDMSLSYTLIMEQRGLPTVPLLENAVSIKPIHDAKKDEVTWQSSRDLYMSSSDLIEAVSNLSDRYEPTHKVETWKAPKIRISERVAGLVSKLKTLSSEAQVNLLLEFMKDFKYTLDPGLLSRNDPLDDFLFNKKSGFCEHFAAAFSTVLRLAGTESRVVTGFHGGTLIGESGYMLVRNSDAHAWSEVWISDRWLRVDPTTVIDGGENHRTKKVSLGSLPAALMSYYFKLLASNIWKSLPDIDDLTIFLFLFSAVLLVFVVFTALVRRYKALPRWRRAWISMELRLERLELSRRRDEGICDFMERCSGHYPALSAEFSRIARTYSEIVFAKSFSCNLPKELVDDVKTCLKNLKKTGAIK